MAESKLRTLSIDFAVHILNLVKFLKSQQETIVSNQIGRAGTSIGANIHEAQYAHSNRIYSGILYEDFYRTAVKCERRQRHG